MCYFTIKKLSVMIHVLSHVPMSHAAILSRRHPLQIPPPQFRGSCQCVGSLVSYNSLCVSTRCMQGTPQRVPRGKISPLESSNFTLGCPGDLASPRCRSQSRIWQLPKLRHITNQTTTQYQPKTPIDQLRTAVQSITCCTQSCTAASRW